MSRWTGDLADDCFLERYGMFAHVECMDRGIWWFSISDGKELGSEELYNSSNMATSIRLKTGNEARAAAEHCMELLRQKGKP